MTGATTIQVTPNHTFKYPISSTNVTRRSSPQETFNEISKTTQLPGIDVRDDFWNRCRVYKKRPKNIFFSQLYSIFHLACTITLLRISGNSIRLKELCISNDVYSPHRHIHTKPTLVHFNRILLSWLPARNLNFVHHFNPLLDN